MPVFKSLDGHAVQLAPAGFEKEKALQEFIERNLEVLLGMRLIASEFPTGEKHGGRIDTLGLDEAGNPVILEYKWDKSDSVMNQGLFYLDWLMDHRGDFVVAAQKAAGLAVEVHWESPRVIIVASSYTKYDTYAVNQLGANIELLRYQLYREGFFVLENAVASLSAKPAKQPLRLPSAKAEDVAYTLEDHLGRAGHAPREAFMELRDLILALEGVTERANQKSQITYRTAKSFAACSLNKKSVQIQFKGGPAIQDPEHRAKDITSYQWGYGWMCELKDSVDVAPVFELVRHAYEFEK